jgi:hypothetical protein
MCFFSKQCIVTLCIKLTTSGSKGNSLNSVSGLTYSVSAILEIEAVPQNNEAGRSLVALYNEYGSESDSFINELNNLVNNIMPNNL